MRFHLFISLVLGFLFVVSPMRAQQPETQQPAPAPANPQKAETKDAKDPDKTGANEKSLVFRMEPTAGGKG